MGMPMKFYSENLYISNYGIPKLSPKFIKSNEKSSYKLLYNVRFVKLLRYIRQLNLFP